MANSHPNSDRTPNLIATLGLPILFIIAFFPVIRSLVESWIQSGDHSHGFLIVPMSLYIVWRNRREIKQKEIHAGSCGWQLVTMTIVLYIFSYYAGISTMGRISLVMTIWAIVWALFGNAIFKAVLFPMLLMIMMIPVPAQFYSMATIPLQLMVSKASAWIAGLFGVPIFREGNVLHMPERTLAVVHACSGLRSLMSLLTISAIFGYFTLSSNLLRGLLIISSVPAAIIVNIIRVVMLILAFKYVGFDLSNGVPHTIFGVGVFVLTILIIALLERILSKWDIKAADA